jgi:hypothetical protein
VSSGWVMHELAQQEVLVPAGYAIEFDPQRATLPLRTDAAPRFATLALALDTLPQRAASRAFTDALASELAQLAEDADAYTLLQLLQRVPVLVDTPLYPRLAAALGVDANDAQHRARWRAGDVAAMNAWWQRLPVQPKQWWWQWRDAL